MSLNYILEIKAFYDWLESNRLTSASINLWHALMHIANKTGWQDDFSAPISTLSSKTGLERKAIQRARNQLQQAGRIRCIIPKGNQAVRYTIIPFSGPFWDNNCPINVPKVSHNCPANRPINVPINKLNKTKRKESDTDVSPKKKFTPPTPDEVATYCQQRGNHVNAQQFCDFYASKGWYVGKNKMADWRAAVRTWEQKDRQQTVKKLSAEELYGRL